MRAKIATAFLIASALCATLATAACQELSGNIGSETNFLSSCDAGCASGLTCLCGVCTVPCSSSDDCRSLDSGADCRAPGENATSLCGGEEAAFCDRECGEDADCSKLGTEFRCLRGVCRSDGNLAPDACPSTTLEVGPNERTLTVGDTVRSYVVHLPATYAGNTSVPLVLDFHTLGGTPSGEADNSGYREVAEREGFIVAWPQGIDGAWNIGPCCTNSRTVDDVAFARAIVEQVGTEACVDRERVYAVGVAMGGGMAYQLGCNAADLFVGIAPSSFDLLAEADQPCAPAEPVTVVSFRGTADTLVPYEGGSQPAPNLPDVTMNFLGAVETFEKWADLDDCTGSPGEPDADGCATYSDCAGGAEVALCTVEGGLTDWGSAEVGWATLKRHSR